MRAPSTGKSIAAALTSWRLGSIALLSIPSGLPLGLVWTLVPTWLTMQGVDIKTVGVITLSQAPYAFKFLWSPLIDRFVPPWLGRKRGWILLAQMSLAVLHGLLAAVATNLEVGVVAALTLLVAFASATQDIALDAYAVEALEPSEHGLASGARTAMYRVAFWMTGRVAISVGPTLGWDVTIAIQAALYLASLPVTVFAPEPRVAVSAPTSLRDAVWRPFVEFFRTRHALEIAAFFVLYKLADNLAQSLVTPFLVQVGFTPAFVGVYSGAAGLVGILVGTLLGGFFTSLIGVNRALWIFGLLQAVSNAGYGLVAHVGANAPLMLGAVFFESACTGLGTAAFGALLLRLTQKQFSATQYALFSSIFALGRTLAGPVAGAFADAIGWRDFFLLSIASAVPGMLLLLRFAPYSAPEIREPQPAPIEDGGRPMTVPALVGTGLVAGIAGGACGLLANAALEALKAARGGAPFDVSAPLWASLAPAKPADALSLVGAIAFGVVVGFAVSGYLAARRGVARSAPSNVGGV